MTTILYLASQAQSALKAAIIWLTGIQVWTTGNATADAVPLLAC